MIFRAGDIVKFRGYADYYATFGILVSQGSGLFALDAIVRDGDNIRTRQYDLVFTDQGYITRDRGVGVLIKKVPKAEYTRFLRQLAKGTINWGPGELNG